MATRWHLLAAMALAALLSAAAPNYGHLLSACAASARVEQSATDKDFQAGVQAYNQGDYVPAANHFYKVLLVRPTDTTLLSWYANSLLGAGEQQKALQVYRQIVQLAPKSPAADLARKLMTQMSGLPMGMPSAGLPSRQADAPLLESYGHVLQELKELGGYHTQVLALERGVIAVPDSIQAIKSLLSLAYNPRDGSVTAVGVGQGANEQKSLATATTDATRWLAALADWQVGRFTTSYADRKNYGGVVKVVAREKLANGWSVVVMSARLAAQGPPTTSASVAPPVIPLSGTPPP